jgi:cytochrome o ubiquinol oxidase subunit III
MTSHETTAYDITSKTVFGFWIYLMSDCLLFGSLFATYAVLRNRTFGGPSPHDLFSLPFVLNETIILLTSSFTCGLAMLAASRNETHRTLLLLGVTLFLGLLFVTLEVSEFGRFIGEGASFSRSGFLSSYFTLVGTHGLHVTLGSIWMAVLMIYIALRGLTAVSMRRLICLSLFWHFLDIVWIFIFTIVYLMGAL